MYSPKHEIVTNPTRPPITELGRYNRCKTGTANRISLPTNNSKERKQKIITAFIKSTPLKYMIYIVNTEVIIYTAK
jgi:hypothetical protein